MRCRRSSSKPATIAGSPAGLPAPSTRNRSSPPPAERRQPVVSWQRASARTRPAVKRLLVVQSARAVTRTGGRHAHRARQRSHALLRGSGPGPAPRLRPRVRRRLPELASPGALLRAALPHHRLQRARLSAVRRAEGRERLLAGARGGRHPRPPRRARASRKAHVCGLSMGGYATLHFGLRHPDRALSLVVAGAGYGSVPGERERFRKDVEETVRRFEADGMVGWPTFYTQGPHARAVHGQGPEGLAGVLRPVRRPAPRRATRSPCGASR